LEDPRVCRKIIIKWIFERWDGDVEWISLAKDMDRYLAFVNALMNV
jgi:hypothetical protein